MYEIYTGTDKRGKTYIVSTDTKTNVDDLKHYTRRYFHVGLDRIGVSRGWLINDELWFENPRKKGQKICWVAQTQKKGA